MTVAIYMKAMVVLILTMEKEIWKMKKGLGVMLGIVIIVAMVSACSKGYETQKTVGGMKIMLTADRYPLVKGDNSMNVKVADFADKAVSDAKVDIRYYMPAMPGMAPMEYSTQAAAKGSSYAFGANIAMEGGWKVDVTVTSPGKAPITATFNVDAR